jgi:hypothetical protein
MSEVKPINSGRIRRILDDLSLSHREDEDGDLIGSLQADKDVSYGVGFVISLKGDNKNLLEVTIVPQGNDVPSERKGESLLWCNTWNATKGWPKAYFHEQHSKIIGEFSIDIEKGIHDELLKDMLLKAIGGGWAMYKELAKEGL